jgi:hypothetical protein
MCLILSRIEKKFVVRDTAFIITGGNTKKNIALKVPRQFQFLLILKTDWRKGRHLETDEGKIMGNGAVH